jgi:hypothetical protein
MQGFNRCVPYSIPLVLYELTGRYIPPEYDPKHASTLNAHQGKKHALGKRAKDIDKGILIVRYVYVPCAIPQPTHLALSEAEIR